MYTVIVFFEGVLFWTIIISREEWWFICRLHLYTARNIYSFYLSSIVLYYVDHSISNPPYIEAKWCQSVKGLFRKFSDTPDGTGKYKKRPITERIQKSTIFKPTPEYRFTIHHLSNFRLTHFKSLASQGVSQRDFRSPCCFQSSAKSEWRVYFFCSAIDQISTENNQVSRLRINFLKTNQVDSIHRQDQVEKRSGGIHIRKNRNKAIDSQEMTCRYYSLTLDVSTGRVIRFGKKGGYEGPSSQPLRSLDLHIFLLLVFPFNYVSKYFSLLSKFIGLSFINPPTIEWSVNSNSQLFLEKFRMTTKFCFFGLHETIEEMQKWACHRNLRDIIPALRKNLPSRSADMHWVTRLWLSWSFASCCCSASATKNSNIVLTYNYEKFYIRYQDLWQIRLANLDQVIFLSSFEFAWLEIGQRARTFRR